MPKELTARHVQFLKLLVKNCSNLNFKEVVSANVRHYQAFITIQRFYSGNSYKSCHYFKMPRPMSLQPFNF